MTVRLGKSVGILEATRDEHLRVGSIRTADWVWTFMLFVDDAATMVPASAGIARTSHGGVRRGTTVGTPLPGFPHRRSRAILAGTDGGSTRRTPVCWGGRPRGRRSRIGHRAGVPERASGDRAARGSPSPSSRRRLPAPAPDAGWVEGRLSPGTSFRSRWRGSCPSLRCGTRRSSGRPSGLRRSHAGDPIEQRHHEDLAATGLTRDPARTTALWIGRADRGSGLGRWGVGSFGAGLHWAS